MIRLLVCLWLAEAGQAARPRELLSPTPDDVTRLRGAVLKYVTPRPPPPSDGSPEAAVLELVDAARALVPRAERFASVRAGRGHVYFRHFRKASGTSLRHWLIDGLSAKKKKNLPGYQWWNAKVNMTVEVYAEMEYGEFPVFCLVAAPRTVFVTCLREPVARHVSEFWYKGYGKQRLTHEGVPRNETAEAVQWRLWVREDRRYAFHEPSQTSGEELIRIGAPMSSIKLPYPETTTGPHGNWKLNDGVYVDNYYTRGLTGTCGPEGSKDERERSVCNFGGDLALGCSWDDRRVGRNVSEADLAFAAAVLDRYDVVLVTELLEQPRTVAYVADLLGFPATAVPGHFNDMHGHPDPDPETRAFLERDNAFDAVLYRRAVDRIRNATRA